MKEKNNNLYNFSIESPYGFIAVVVLYVIGSASFPSDFFSFIPGPEKDVCFISMFIVRMIFSIVPFWLMFEVKVNRLLFAKEKCKTHLLLIPFFVVALNNFPFCPFIGKEITLVSDVTWKTIIFYIAACFGGVILEECVFRGLVFPVILRKLNGKKNAVFLSVLISSLLFGGAHLVNLFNGVSIGSVVMQIGYSILVGGMCAVALFISGNIFYPVVLHLLFNIGGLLTGYGIISGVIWTPLSIIITAVIAVCVSVYTLVILHNAGKYDYIFEKIDCVE